MSKPHILVLGAGVIGLSTAFDLLSLPGQPYRVTILADEFTPSTTSDGAGGIWFPYKAEPMDKIIRWCISTKKRFEQFLKENEPCGVEMGTGYWFEHGHAPETEQQRVAHEWWRPFVTKWRRLEAAEVPKSVSYGYFMEEVPLIVTPQYMKWMMGKITKLGGTFVQGHVESIQATINEFKSQQVTCVINCLGLGAAKVLGDKEMSPIRGVLVRVKLPEGHPVKHFYFDDENPEGIVYIFPRKDVCILGGMADKGNFSREARLDEVQGIINRCLKLEPKLADATIVDTWVGLRPGRTGVRVERDTSYQGALVVHNYGHGGSGWTVQFGCSEEVTNIVQSNLKPKSKL
jgi:D-amino-acid oxidase